MDQGEFRELQERYNNLKELSSQGMFEYERDERIPLIMLAYWGWQLHLSVGNFVSLLSSRMYGDVPSLNFWLYAGC